MIFDEKVKKNWEENGHNAGTTACVVLITPDMIFCSNAGDSRAVLKSNGKTIPLSEDHKPDDPEESRRINNT